MIHADQTVTMDIPPQDVITRDNVTVRVNAVTYFNVVDPIKATVAIQKYVLGTSQVAQTTLRSILGQVDLDDLLVNRDEVNQRLQRIIDGLTDPWGVKVARRDQGRRAARYHAARGGCSGRGRTRAARQGDPRQREFEAAETLSLAGEMLERRPGAMQLGLLSTMTEVAAERNSTLIFPVPIELLRFAAAAAAPPRAPDGDSDEPAGSAG